MRLRLATIALIALQARARAAPSAEDLYAQGQAAYNAADYATAIATWTKSYELSDEPELLFNIAQAQRLSGDCVHALSSYKRFVEIDPTSEQRRLADDFVKELEPTCGASKVRPSTPSGRTLKVAGIATGGAGIAILATGLLFGRRAFELGDEVSNACSTLCAWDEQRGKNARGRRDAAIGYVLDGLGVAAMAGGAIMYYIGQRRSGLTLSPHPSEGGAVVTWSGSW